MADNERKDSSKSKVCFVVMPISDMSPYSPGHFHRVYEYIIKPVCRKAGFNPIRADEDKNSNLIIGSVIKSIVEAELVIVDLSGRNPNVMYELGLRQAFNMPTVLIKDKSTERVFDIQGLRDVEYDTDLRVDNVNEAIDKILEMIEATYNSHIEGKKEINSLIQLLSIVPAKIPENVTISSETNIILDAIRDLSDRIYSLENKNKPNVEMSRLAISDIALPAVGTTFKLMKTGEIGTVKGLTENHLLVEMEGDTKMRIDLDDWMEFREGIRYLSRAKAPPSVRSSSRSG